MDNLAPARLSEKFKPVQTASYGDDSGAVAMFDDEFVKNDYKSEQQARTVYDHYYCIEIQWPGDKTKSFKYKFPTTQTNNQYIERFPKQWEAFKNATQQMPDGTPIELWPPIDKRMVLELKASRIYTVEQIAAIRDSDVQAALGLEGRKLRDQALAFLNPSVSQVQVSKLSRENEDLRHQMDVLNKQMEAMAAGQPVHKKRGPKPKIVEE